MSELPFNVPPPSSPVTTTKSGLLAFLDSLGESGRTRPQARVSNAFVAIGGALVPLALAILFAGDSESASGVYIATLISLSVAFLLRFKDLLPAQFVPAAVPAAVSSLVLAFLFLIGDSGMEPGLGLLLAGFAHIGLWFAPGFRGSSLLLGAGTFVAIVGLVALLSQNASPIFGDFASDDLPVDIGSYFVQAGIGYLILGSLVILGVYFLDERGYHAVATSLVAPGMLAIVSGVFSIVLEIDNAGSGVLFFLAGAGISFVGHKGQRRAMIWWGATITVVGTVAFIVFAIQPDSSSTIGLAVLISAALLIIGPTAAAKIQAAGADSTNQ